jgi:glucose/arabinose dehydrogenase
MPPPPPHPAALRRASGLLVLMLAAGCGGETTATFDAGVLDATPNDAPDAGPEDAPLALSFEPIELEGEPHAVTSFRFLPGSLELVLLEKDGVVAHYRVEGDQARRLGDFTVPEVFAGADCGLISAAFDPDYADNGYLYLGSCVSLEHSRITRHVFDPDDYAAATESTVEILRLGDEEAYRAWHNIGSIGFDEQGYLWALMGDKQLPATAQQLENELGAVVRIIPSRTPDVGGFEPAPDNPFANEPDASAAIWAYGLRSPWTGHLDAEGRLWVGDVGESGAEEVNLVSPGGGENFGWPLWEGPCEDACDGLADPVVYWDREPDHLYVLEDPDTAPTTRRAGWVGLSYRDRGNDRYQGRFTGRLVFGDFCTGWVRALLLDADGLLLEDRAVGNLIGVSAWDQGPDGYAYVSTYGSALAFPYRPGGLWRAVLAPPP